MDWLPPSHDAARQIHASFLQADGGRDIRTHLDLSGEPQIPELAEKYGLKQPMALLEYQDNTTRGLAFENAYSDYWNSTANEDG